jgi:hypothetical protein
MTASKFNNRAATFVVSAERANSEISPRQWKLIERLELRAEFVAGSKQQQDYFDQFDKMHTFGDASALIKRLAARVALIAERKGQNAAKTAVKQVAAMATPRPTMAEIGRMTLEGKFGMVGQRKARALVTA